MSRKTKKKFTVPEFKTWLEGIMQFQDESWSPNREQWEEIYTKIMDLKEPINREKVSLTDPTLDEINGIVYDQIREAFTKLNLNRPVNYPTLNPNPNSNSQLSPDDPWSNIGRQSVPDQQTDTSKLENLSLNDLKQQYEEKQREISGAGAAHKLPDRIEQAGPPDDFV